MTVETQTLKSFPKPSELTVPAGAEGWEQLYPYSLVFDNAPGGDEKFWFCDSQHWPTVFKPFETIGGEFAVHAFDGCKVCWRIGGQAIGECAIKSQRGFC